MRIIFRNFIRLLSSGTFGTEVSIEQMSDFKWRQLLHIAGTCNVSDFISSGIVRANKNDGTAIPYKIIEAANRNITQDQEPCPKKGQKTRFTQLPVKKFTNFYLNRKLNKIIFNEIHSIDTSVDTLTFMNMLIDHANTMLDTGINLRELANLGLYLRKNGDTIDFVKTERWIRQLKMRRISDLTGSLIVVLFGFDTQEIPFLKKFDKNSNKYVLAHLSNAMNDTSTGERADKQDEQAALSIIRKPGKATFGFFTYFPLEKASIFISGIIKSLSNIEE